MRQPGLNKETSSYFSATPMIAQENSQSYAGGKEISIAGDGPIVESKLSSRRMWLLGIQLVNCQLLTLF